MKHYVKRCLAALLAIVLAFTMFPSSVARASEAKALQEATQAAGGGSGQEAPQAVDEMGLLASFDFNTEALDGKFVSKDVTAAIVGTGAALQDRDEAHGKALYLDGASYLDLKKSDGSSLLTGQKEITISFEAKPARSDTNWGFFAAPNANKQEYQKEHYIGALISGGSTTIERYNNNGSRPASVSAATGTDWSHVDVVLAEAETVLYVDGTKAAAQASSYSLADILGNNSIFQLGKANWGDGEYCQGWIDNFQIYSKALSEEEIQTIPSEAYRQAVLEKQAAKIASVTLEEERVNLPDYNGTVTWKSSLDAVVIAENGRTAAVKQPAVGTAPVMGKLTAVVSVYGLTKEVEVDAVIKPQVGENEPYGYLMVHFVEDSNGYAEKIYLDISRGDNPEQWDPLNGREPILASNLGTSGSRDPFITYSPETETYYILGTDLRVFGGDNAQWEAWQQNYSTKMNIWE